MATERSAKSSSDANAPSLHECIEAHRARIVDRFAARLAASTPRPLRVSELVDDVPAFLGEVSRMLRVAVGGSATELPEPFSLARKHGAERLRAGFDLATVIAEYDLLRECVWDVASEAGAYPTNQESAAFGHALVVAIHEVAVVYVARALA